MIKEMNKEINCERLIMSLFYIGFDEVNCVQYTYILGYLLKNNLLKDFKFVKDELSSKFLHFFDYSGGVYKFKNGMSLSSRYTYELSLPDFLHTTLEYNIKRLNTELINILKAVYKDINDIMISYSLCNI